MPKDSADWFMCILLVGMIALYSVGIYRFTSQNTPLMQQVCRVEYIKQTIITTCWNEERKK